MIGSDYGFMTRLIGNASTLRDQLAQTQEQVSTGLVSDTYAGLGNAGRTSLNLSRSIAHQTAYSGNIDAAQGRLGLTQTALTSIADIASKFFAQINTYSASDAGSTQVLAQQANSALQQVGDLLNTKSGDVYVFAGNDTDHAPVPNTDPAVISAAVLSTSPGTAPFSATIGTTAPTVQVGAGQSVQVGALANANTLAVSAAPTTGSYTRDIMTALAKIAGLATSTTGTADIASARGYLGSAISAMATETGVLGNVQSDLTDRKAQLAALGTAMSKQLSDVQDVDAAAALSKASLLQTQLQASYQIIAGTRQLSLANYL